MILARPYRLRAETRSAYYLVRVLADPNADRELVRGAENAFTLAAQHLAQAQELIAYQGVSEHDARSLRRRPTLRVAPELNGHGELNGDFVPRSKAHWGQNGANGTDQLV